MIRQVRSQDREFIRSLEKESKVKCWVQTDMLPLGTSFMYCVNKRKLAFSCYVTTNTDCAVLGFTAGNVVHVEALIKHIIQDVKRREIKKLIYLRDSDNEETITKLLMGKGAEIIDDNIVLTLNYGNMD